MTTNHTCGLCPNETSTSLCAQCAEDLAFLGVTDLPAPDASQEDVRAWAKANGVQVFSCGRIDDGFEL